MAQPHCSATSYQKLVGHGEPGRVLAVDGGRQGNSSGGLPRHQRSFGGSGQPLEHEKPRWPSGRPLAERPRQRRTGRRRAAHAARAPRAACHVVVRRQAACGLVPGGTVRVVGQGGRERAVGHSMLFGGRAMDHGRRDQRMTEDDQPAADIDQPFLHPRVAFAAAPSRPGRRSRQAASAAPPARSPSPEVWIVSGTIRRGAATRWLTKRARRAALVRRGGAGGRRSRPRRRARRRRAVRRPARLRHHHARSTARRG